MISAALKNLAIKLEEHAVTCGMHIALTGGTLYKDGVRKDIDFVLYHASNSTQSEDALKQFFRLCHFDGFGNIINYGRVTKMTYGGQKIDILYPEYKREEIPGNCSDWDLDTPDDVRRKYAIFDLADIT